MWVFGACSTAPCACGGLVLCKVVSQDRAVGDTSRGLPCLSVGVALSLALLLLFCFFWSCSYSCPCLPPTGWSCQQVTLGSSTPGPAARRQLVGRRPRHSGSSSSIRQLRAAAAAAIGADPGAAGPGCRPWCIDTPAAAAAAGSPAARSPVPAAPAGQPTPPSPSADAGGIVSTISSSNTIIISSSAPSRPPAALSWRRGQAAGWRLGAACQPGKAWPAGQHGVGR